MSRATISALFGVAVALAVHASLPSPVVQLAAVAAVSADPGAPAEQTSPLRPSGRTFSFLRPPPTENWLGDGAEKRNKTARKAWMKTIHRAPPDLDYKTLEKANGLAQLAKRNDIALGRTSAPRMGDWTERGSSNQAGRMHVALHSPDGTELWAGSAKGGIWHKPVGSVASAWTAIGDNLYGGAHHLLVLAMDAGPDVVIAATDSGLIHRSTDNGASWEEPTGLPWRWGVRRLLSTGDGVFVSIWEANWEGWSLWRSTNAGASFTRVRDFEDYAGDVWSPRDGSDDLYILDGGDVLISTDGGDSWTTVGTIGPSVGGELVGSEAGAPTLYAVLENNDARRLWRSDDAGANWTNKHAVTDYWTTLNASMIDDDLVAWGGVEVHRSTDGGDSFAVVNTWGEYYDDPANLLHADIPGLDVVPDGTGGEIWYISTDGGLYHSTDGLATVQNLSLDGLRVSQYYSTLTSSANPNHIAAGAQDQGYQISYAVGDGLVQFDQILSGDYGHLTSGDGTHAIVYACYPGFVLVQIGEDTPSLGFVDFPDGENQAWLPPLRADPEDREAFFFAATHLYYYTRDPGTDDWTPEQWSTQDFASTDGEYISAVAISPLDPDRMYLSTSIGRLFRSSDKGRTWTRSNTDGPEAHYFYGNAMVASAEDIDLVYVGGSGYDGPAVWRSVDGGVTWTEFGEGLPATLVYGLAEAKDGSGELFAGTETAAYQRAQDGDEWVDITGTDAPVTIYWSVETLGGGVVRYGTYGRGIWDYAWETLDDCVDGFDGDGDGSPCDVDCDDRDGDVYPGAPEACDGVDADCDPSSPDEADADGDGFLACDDDCDDTRASVNPDGEETCNDRDDDCDGVLDNDATDAERRHLDADGDGFGVAEESILTCEPQDGYVDNVLDCDDDDPDIHPDAAEICGDGRDNDCEDGDRPCENVDGGDGCEDCGASMVGSPAPLLALLPLLARRRRREPRSIPA